VFFHKQPVKEGGFSGLEREREREREREGFVIFG
jgi:hypothetical protein